MPGGGAKRLLRTIGGDLRRLAVGPPRPAKPPPGPQRGGHGCLLTAILIVLVAILLVMLLALALGGLLSVPFFVGGFG